MRRQQQPYPMMMKICEEGSNCAVLWRKTLENKPTNNDTIIFLWSLSFFSCSFSLPFPFLFDVWVLVKRFGDETNCVRKNRSKSSFISLSCCCCYWIVFSFTFPQPRCYHLSHRSTSKNRRSIFFFRIKMHSNQEMKTKNKGIAFLNFSSIFKCEMKNNQKKGVHSINKIILLRYFQTHANCSSVKIIRPSVSRVELEKSSDCSGTRRRVNSSSSFDEISRFDAASESATLDDLQGRDSEEVPLVAKEP